jgi:hypothetical protein
MPPGFLEGFGPTLDADYQVTMEKGIASVFGSEVRVDDDTQLVDSDFVGSKLGPNWFYIYLDRSGGFHVDRLIPTFEDTFFYYRHPLSEWRALGRLWVGSDDEILYVQSDVSEVSAEVSIVPSDSSIDSFYECDGENDQVVINAAIDYVSGAFGGGVVRLRPGTFTTSGKVYIDADGVALRGDGSGSVTIKRTDNYETVQVEGTAATSVTGVEVSGLKLTRTDSGTSATFDVSYADDSLFRDLLIDGCHYGVRLNVAERCEFDSITIKEPEDRGFNCLTFNNTDCRMSNLLIDGNEDRKTDLDVGLLLSGTGWLATQITIVGLYSEQDVSAISLFAQACIVLGLEIRNINASGSATAKGVFSFSGSYHLCSNVRVYNVDSATAANSYGIDDTASSSRHSFVGCDVRGCSGTGVRIQGDYCVFSGSSYDNGTNVSDTGTGNVFLGLDSGSSQTGPLDVNGDLAVDTDTLYVDAANDRVGVNTSSPSVELDVSGNQRLSGVFTTLGSGAKITLERTTPSSGGQQIRYYDDDATYPLDWRLGVPGSSNAQNLFVFDNSGGGGTVQQWFRGGDVAFDTDTLYVDAGNDRVGVNIATPDKAVEILSASESQLRLTHTDATDYADFTVDSDGDLTIVPSGADINIGDNSNVQWDINFHRDAGAEGDNIGTLKGMWDGTEVARIALRAGPDTANKDDGRIVFSTGTGGSLSVAMSIDESGDIEIDIDTLYVDSANDRIGINTASPANLLHVYENTANVDSSAGVTIEQDGPGDAVLHFFRTAAERWVIGIDGSDGDKFKIVDGANLGAGADFVLDTSGSLAIDTDTLYVDATNDSVGVNTSSPSSNADLTLGGGALCLAETTTPTADTNFGKVYTKSDNKLYFQDGAGTEHEIAFA